MRSGCPFPAHPPGCLYFLVLGVHDVVVAAAAIAGLALLATIGNGLVTAVKEEAHREPAVITFLVTLSGVTLWGIGSAFWGVVAGALALLVAQWGRRPAGGQGGAR